MIFILIGFSGFSQEDDSTVMLTQDLKEIRYDKNFSLHYAQQLNLIRRTYPLALKAKEVIDSLDAEIAQESKRRKQKKIAKATKKELEEELEYLIKDLYMGEGKMLFKLIYRETGMTVTEILAKYKSPIYAKTIQATFSLYGHDTNSTFDAEGDDWIAELVLQDIEAGRRTIDMRIQGMTKEQYRQNLKDYREYRKGLRKNKRKSRKAKRKARRNEE
ncbi:MAG: hypothetical protein Crog3KO_01810 [Crocinitomicaceae bacterium]